MATKPVLTDENGAPAADNQHSQSAGPNGPLLLQDHHLIEKLARFDRERIPERGSSDVVRDPRGFALKFHTEDGNYDPVDNGTPIFFIKDPQKFPDFIHSQKRDPLTNMQEPDNAWDFFSHSPKATHQFTSGMIADDGAVTVELTQSFLRNCMAEFHARVSRVPTVLPCEN